MKRSQWAGVLARRLSIDRGRIDNIGLRAAEAGIVPRAEGSRRYPPDLSTAAAVNLLLAVLADDGLGKVAQQVKTFGSLSDGATTLHDALVDLLESGPALAGTVRGSLALRLDAPSASLVTGGLHRRFGPEPPPGTAGRNVVVPGRALAALGLEFGGHSPDAADELVALARITASPSVGLAFHNIGFA